jgi:hypothetical protein
MSGDLLQGFQPSQHSKRCHGGTVTVTVVIGKRAVLYRLSAVIDLTRRRTKQLSFLFFACDHEHEHGRDREHDQETV